MAILDPLQSSDMGNGTTAMRRLLPLANGSFLEAHFKVLSTRQRSFMTASIVQIAASRGMQKQNLAKDLGLRCLLVSEGRVKVAAYSSGEGTPQWK